MGKARTRYAYITRIAFTNQAVEPHLHGTAMYSVQTTSSLQNQLVLQAHPYNTAKSGQTGVPCCCSFLAHQLHIAVVWGKLEQAFWPSWGENPSGLTAARLVDGCEVRQVKQWGGWQALVLYISSNGT